MKHDKIPSAKQVSSDICAYLTYLFQPQFPVSPFCGNAAVHLSLTHSIALAYTQPSQPLTHYLLSS